MKGILYGIGTGPGDSLLMTQKALETVKACDVVALPAADKENCTAYKIVKGVYSEIDSKEFLFLNFPMTKEKAVLEKAHKTIAEKLCTALNQGKNVAFITIGDVTVYSTFMYGKSLVEENGFETVLINGIPSFCAVAARLGISLSEKEEEIHIIPSSYDISQSFKLKGTLVYMKSGRQMAQLKEFLLAKRATHNFDFYAVSNCGMPDERILSLEELACDTSYFTVVIIKHIRPKIEEKHFQFFQNTECEMFPCHGDVAEEDFNCLFCYCPLYSLGKNCGGNCKYTEKGVKSCVNCNFPHKKENYAQMIEHLRTLKNG